MSYKNPEDAKANKAKYYKKNRKSLLAKSNARYEDDPDLANSKSKDRYAQNRERICAQRRASRAANPGHFRAYEKAWAKKNPDRRKKTQKAASLRWRAKNPAHTKALDRGRWLRLRNSTFDAMGGCCVGCGSTDRRLLQIDHKFGDGNVERRIGLDQATLYRRLRDGKADRSRYQLMCPNCHFLKQYYPNDARPLTILGGVQCEA